MNRVAEHVLHPGPESAQFGASQVRSDPATQLAVQCELAEELVVLRCRGIDLPACRENADGNR